MTDTAPIVRFAPSPTGRLHIGNARTALFNWLIGKPDGQFVLRLDDTDAERSTTEFADGIIEDLRWLGIEPDRVERQSDRVGLYDEAANRLRAAGLLYPCYDTPDELERQRKRQMAARKPPIYDRRALRMSDDERAAFENEGRKPHWRFLLPNHDGDPDSPQRTEVTWDDIVRGPQTIDLASMSDPVLIREDGTCLYTLPSVVDDAEMGITHVVRGDDHVTNTAAQIALFGALERTVPQFGHHNLLTTIDGEGLSKRKGSLSLQSLREDDIEPQAVASLAVRTGMSGEVSAFTSLDAMREGFDASDASKSLAKFDPAELISLNSELVHGMEFADVRDRLHESGIADADEAFWLAVRANCERVRDARVWWNAIHQTPERKYDEADADFVRTAFDLLPAGPVDGETWSRWVARIKGETDRKGRSLFMPLRLALTGLDHGPELRELLPLIGREGIEARRP